MLHMVPVILFQLGCAPVVTLILTVCPYLGFHKFRLHMYAIVGCGSGHRDGSDLGMAFLVSKAMKELLQHLLATVLTEVAASTTDEGPR
jgi:hypothetical protein